MEEAENYIGLDPSDWQLVDESIESFGALAGEVHLEGAIVNSEGSQIDISFVYNVKDQSFELFEISYDGIIPDDSEAEAGFNDMLSKAEPVINELLGENADKVHMKINNAQKEVFVKQRGVYDYGFIGDIINTLNGDTIEVSIGLDNTYLTVDIKLDDIEGYKNNATLEEIVNRGVEMALKNSDFILENSIWPEEIKDLTGGVLLTDWIGATDPHNQDLGLIELRYHVDASGVSELSAYANSAEGSTTIYSSLTFSQV